MNYFTTDNETVDAIGEINFSGNITPQIWYKTIITEKGKPHYLAISILSDIVYWYRPTEVRDENTGRVIGWKKRFKEDLLQRSYDQFAEMYGESKKTITRAILLLEDLGVVQRVFRSVTLSSGMVLNNVLYLSFDVKKLTELTYPQKQVVENNEKRIVDFRKSQKEMPETPVNKPIDNSVHPSGQICREGMDKSGERVWTDLDRPMDNSVESLPTNLGRPIPTDVQTNTKITSQITDIDYNNHINLSGEKKKTDAMDEIEAVTQFVKENIEYDYLKQTMSYGDKETVDEILDLMIETIVVKREYIRIGNADYPYALVKSRFMKIDSSSVKYVIDCLNNNTTKVRNIRAYLLTALYNAPATINSYYRAEVNHDMYGGGFSYDKENSI